MPRHLVIGNGHIAIGFDDTAQIRDIYYPYVGELNHVGGHRCAIGVWVDGKFSWWRDPEWQFDLGYHEKSLVTNIRATHPGMELSITSEDAVHQRLNVYLKRMTITNLAPEGREVRVFFNNDLMISETEVGDTAVYDPERHVIYHYKRGTYFLFNGATEGTRLFQYSTGVKRFNHSEGTWRDAEDGELMENPIAQGSVDSVISFRLFLKPGETQLLNYWMAIGSTLDEVTDLDEYVKDSGVNMLLDRVIVYWQRWAEKSGTWFADLPSRVRDLFYMSLLMVRVHTDANGAIVAALDSDILQYNRDHYNYVWPRDGALAAITMSEAGYHGMVRPFFRFCADALTDEGYLRHKYNPDGTVGSSWHPYVVQKERRLPIQEDETGLTLIALWRDFVHHQEIDFPQSVYDTLIRPAAAFLARYIDNALELPKPSYDLWEERYGIFTFTSSAVYGGLIAAANFFRLYGNDYLSERYHKTAQMVKRGILSRLYDQERGIFVRGLVRENGRWVFDKTIDSSVFGLWAFDVLPADDERIVRTMEAVESTLTVKTEVGGIGRYEGDSYFRSGDDDAPINPWFISTLWVADWKIAKARTIGDLRAPRETLIWVANHALPSGLLPEQLHPVTGEPLSVSPLTWSHAALASTVLHYIDRYRSLVNASF
ncbi:Glucoamylase (glucan-1,4-alpha-glucosidase), GH15 family [Sulfobacillus thermosulfidooxidans DSM 9293]|uniref:Glucoamylase (Glucan-1,4-alpha-glucosidase), GH15 family n=2 Tax=Sulfobacillus thermosulfidooxidans TaxID=28034 RepID=A0A1W1WK60_SULTA|nr:glycoside hydrolase family 15 protein [Sulfobacillus thermosulfidooxidans]PSR27709.1 MAG: glycoside hydrolase family 15 protein [Sulfobacillus thermosulfidooxidans]SMC06667.1 Glucoamylase (glucan-1,4-alpha-glucosidase), GH15 family [Sulfobacillus thermosulfidooxidans DSM 9293]